MESTTSLMVKHTFFASKDASDLISEKGAMSLGNSGREKTASAFLDLPTGQSIKRVYKVMGLMNTTQKFDSKSTDTSS